ncbi:MAG: hypothetical protein D3921_08515 [Candidatus Electrothrix sp. AW1]|nr:hypothetical protein [Candidatus Electrothrix sp. AX1]MCI5182546.1 hypothetical protein [Candidatus Electrothrix gigas]
MSLCPIKFATLCLVFLSLLLVETTESFAASLDAGFGDNGKVAVNLGSYGDQANAVLVQPDNKILVGGSTSSTADLDFMLFRLLADGSLDSEFNIDGKVSTAVGSNDDEVFALALQKDGKILAAGYSSNNGSRDFALARYKSDGSLDRDFGLEGLVVTAVSDSDDEITGIAVQDDGKILLTGTALGDEGRVVVLSRYQQNGNPDTTFADEGFMLSAVGTDARAESLLLTDEGHILIAGTYQEGENTALMVLGYHADGYLDTSFGYEGVTVPLDGTVPSAGSGLAIRDDGSILVAGSVGKSGERDGALFLFGENGLPDRAFGDKGVLITEDAKDTFFYDALVTEAMVAATGVTVGEDGMRESVLVTYARKEGNNATQLFQQQMTGAAENDEDSEPIAQIVTTEVDNEEDYTFSLAAADAGSVVVAGASGAQEVAQAAVRKYTIFQAGVSDTYWNTDTGNASLFTGQPLEVTRTTSLIPVEISSEIGTVTERGIVFSVDPLPTLKGGNSSDSEDSSAPSMSALSPSGTVSSSSVTLSLTTNVAATCKYTDSSAGMDYSNMKKFFDTTGGTKHSEPVTGLAEGEHTYYVRCKNDSTGVANTTDETIIFTVDTTVIDITQSYFDPDKKTLSVTTDVDAHCKYKKGIDVDYALMTDFTDTDSTLHEETFDTLTKGDIYYVRCQDTEGNTTSVGTAISYTVDPTPPSPQTTSLIHNNFRTGITFALESVSELFVSTAMAQEDTDSTTTTTATTSTSSSTEVDTEDNNFLEQGSVEEGSGTGKFTVKLEDLKPGTVFYARAYAVVNGVTYYGNQISFQTADSCFVATAAYGSIFHPAVAILRNFRDRFMLDNAVSRSLVRLYYRYSPPIADMIHNSTVLRPMTRILLMPIIGAAWLTMRFGWIWLLLPAAALIVLSWFGGMRMKRKACNL